MNRQYILERRKIEVRRQKITLVCVAAILVISILFVNAFSNASTVKASNNNKKFYTSIQIEEGDTLWTIADRFITSEYDSKKSYIEEVKKMNHLYSDDITSGCYLFVPYYAEEPLQH